MIKNWKLFKESIDSESEIHQICKEYNIENYTINDDLSIDVDGNVCLSGLYLNEIPIKFNRVSGNFSCNHNKLKSLKFCPEYVGDGFSCKDNNLTSLEYLSKYIGGFINCRDNKIWSFSGIPDNFRGYFYCKRNNQTQVVNPIEHIWNLFESVKDIEFLNDCDIVREPETPDDLPIVIIERLNFFLETIGKPTVEKVDGYINI
jgi:hypothetical protein